MSARLSLFDQQLERFSFDAAIRLPKRPRRKQANKWSRFPITATSEGQAKRSIIIAAFVLAILHWSAFLASAQFTVTLTGGIIEGSLNGESIAGSDFVMTATIASNVDLFPDETAGVFALSQAVMQIGPTSEFVFDTNNLFFGWAYDPLVGDSGKLTAIFVDDDENVTRNNFGYSGPGTSLPDGFNPNVIRALSFSDFDDALLAGNPPRFVNTASDVLLIERTETIPLTLPGTLTVVPEPNSLLLAMLACVGFLPRRRRI